MPPQQLTITKKKYSLSLCCSLRHNFGLCQSLGEKGSPGEIRTSPGDPGQKGQKGLLGNPGPEGETGATQQNKTNSFLHYLILVFFFIV